MEKIFKESDYIILQGGNRYNVINKRKRKELYLKAN